MILTATKHVFISFIDFILYNTTLFLLIPMVTDIITICNVRAFVVAAPPNEPLKATSVLHCSFRFHKEDSVLLSPPPLDAPLRLCYEDDVEGREQVTVTLRRCDTARGGEVRSSVDPAAPAAQRSSFHFSSVVAVSQFFPASVLEATDTTTRTDRSYWLYLVVAVLRR